MHPSQYNEQVVAANRTRRRRGFTFGRENEPSRVRASEQIETQKQAAAGQPSFVVHDTQSHTAKDARDDREATGFLQNVILYPSQLASQIYRASSRGLGTNSTWSCVRW